MSEVPALAYLYPEHLGRPAARRLQVAAMLRALAGEGVRVHFLVGRFAGMGRHLAELGLAGVPNLLVEPLWMTQAGPGLPVPFSWHGPYHLAARRRLRRLAHSGMGVALVRHLKLADFLLRRGCGLALVYEAHELFHVTAREEGMEPRRLARLEALERRVLAEVDLVFTTSRPLARALEPLCRRPVAALPNGVAREFLEIARRPQAGLVAYAGGLMAWKGVDLLLRAVALLPQARLEILGGEAGSDDWRRLERLAGELGLGERFTMRPRVGQEAVRELLARAAVAVWPGSTGHRLGAEFTSPLKLFEYLAAGCAVAAPDLPAARELLADGDNSLLFTPEDPQDLARVLERLLADRELAGRLGEAGRRLAREYTWQARARRLLELLEPLAAAQREA